MEVRRKRRTDAHRRADVALRHVQPVCAKSGYVTTGPESGADYGIDLALTTFDDDGYLENGQARFQIKSVRRIEPSADGRGFSFALDRRDLDHWLYETDPVVLTVYDVTADVEYWVHIQTYFAELPGFSLRRVGTRVTMRVAFADVLNSASVRAIRDSKNAADQRAARRSEGDDEAG